MKFHTSFQSSSLINRKTISCLVILIIFRLHSFGQNIQIENQIKELDQRQRLWMLKEDANALKKLYDSDLLVNAPFNAVTSGSEVVYHLVQTGFIKLSGFTEVTEKVLLKGEVAVTMGSETVTFEKNSSNPHAGQTIKRRFTHVYLKERGNWMLIARHANEICQ